MVKTNRPLPHRTIEFCNTIGGKADMGRSIVPIISAAFDPKRSEAG
jgi:hypothetical protein